MKYYNQIAKSYNELHGKEQIEKANIILEEIKKVLGIFFTPSQIKGGKNLRLLDIGAGTGISTKLFEPYCDCTALDPSEELLKQYQGKKVIAKAESLPFPDKSFDIIISITALHHANLTKAIKEIQRVAKPNSIIAISFLKKSKKLSEAKTLLNDYKIIEQEKDIIFIKY